MKNIHAWFTLSRPPFHTVGILPFALGTVLAYRIEGSFNFQVFILGITGVVLIMLSTYYGGEYWDYIEDSLSARGNKSPFAGGSGVLQKGTLPRQAALYASIVSLSLALVVGLVLQFVYRTGPFTLLLGLIGLFAGFFYSSWPIRWVRTGFGELWIALCYGWLTVAAGYYIQTGSISSLVHWVAIPIGLTIFNVILLNEFPDYEADRVAGKANILVRLRPKRGVYIYGIVSLAAWIFFALSIHQGVSAKALWLYIPTFILSAVLVVLVLAGRWQSSRTLQVLCGMNILVNLCTTGSYILAFI
jgi:1,4-dihydroxy-2-naphthoate octaprenyltransferase